MKPMTKSLIGIGTLAAITGCASMSDARYTKQAAEVLRASFKESGQAKLDRLNQDQPQGICSVELDKKPPVAQLERMEKAQQELLKYPADGKLLRWAGCLMLTGIALFSGSLYLLVFLEIKWLGMITPFGGVSFLAAWLLLAVFAHQHHDNR